MSVFSELKRRNVIRMAILYVVGSWLILQVAELLTEILSVPEWTLRFVLMILLLGLPLALIFSWVYEITPEGIKKESEIASGESVTDQTAKKLDVVVIALLVSVLGVFVADRLLSSDTQEQPTAAATSEPLPAAAVALEQPQARSVAVLPFADLSAGQANEYFSDGLTETLLHVLAGIPELKVAARTSSFAFKGRNEDVRDIARQLGVAHVLEGSVQRAGDKVRITAQLIRAEDGFHIWSENFDKTLDDIFEIQDDIATEVSKALTVSLLRSGDDASFASVTTSNVAAYDLYLQALSEYRKASVVSLAEAEQLLKRALQIEPDYAEAAAALGSVYLWQLQTGAVPQAEGFEQVIAQAQHALSLDPDNVEAAVLLIEARGRQAYMQGDAINSTLAGEQIRALVDRAKGEVTPKVSYAGFLTWSGDSDSAIVQMQRAIELDPLNPELHYWLGGYYAESDRVSDALAAYDRSLELEPDQPNVYSSYAVLAEEAGDYVSALQYMTRAAELDPADPELPGSIAIMLYELGLPDYAEAYASQAIALGGDSAYTKMVTLIRAHSTQSASQTNAIALDMIEADIENRRGAFLTAMDLYVETAATLGVLDTARARISELYPGFETPLADNIEPRVAIARLRTSTVLLTGAEADAKKAEAAVHRAFYDKAERVIEDVYSANLIVLAFEGNYAQMKRFLIDTVFPSRDVRQPQGFEWRFLASEHAAPIANDPEILAGLARWEANTTASIDALVAYLERQ
ncbi:MAG: tetratricopeptide repeat protein [Pseudomonadota bacterium]